MSNQAIQRVEFTRTQIEFLNSQFPEMVGTAATSSDELRWRAAQRSVVHFIQSRVAKDGGWAAKQSFN